jgi:DNA polymerase III epsilon subunit-like protein
MGHKYLKDYPLAFIDTETTGLDYNRHSIIEFAVVSTIHGEWVTKIQLPAELMAQADPQALKVNGYTPEAWVGAPVELAAYPEIYSRLEGHLIIGQNVAYDLTILDNTLKRLELDSIRKKLPRRYLDTMSFSYEHLAPLGLKSLSLEKVCDFLGIPNEGAHTALVDARRTKAVYDKIMSATIINKLYWKFRNRV